MTTKESNADHRFWIINLAEGKIKSFKFTQALHLSLLYIKHNCLVGKKCLWHELHLQDEDTCGCKDSRQAIPPHTPKVSFLQEAGLTPGIAWCDMAKLSYPDFFHGRVIISILSPFFSLSYSFYAILQVVAIVGLTVLLTNMQSAKILVPCPQNDFVLIY